ncbi:unnamed protein product [Durusdinium trenchii]|uniref:Uncharacterized protein n=2 Tax=Durusdinium trenchii TaxID=1381693 RepID=A0ABP0K474_9DINO
MLLKGVILLTFLSSTAAYRPAKDRALPDLEGGPKSLSSEEVKSEAMSDSETKDEMSDQEGRLKNVTLPTGYIGWVVEPSSGKIVNVKQGTAAEVLGLQAGQHIINVQERQYTFAALAEARKKADEFNQTLSITVMTPSRMEQAVAWVHYCMSMPSGFVGCLLTLSLPWMIYQSMSNGLYSKASSRPVLFAILSSAIGHCLGRIARALLEWRSLTFGGMIQIAGDQTVYLGLALGCLAMGGNQFLNKPLPKDISTKLIHVEMVALPPFCVFALCRTAVSFLMNDLFSGDCNISKLIRGFSGIPDSSLVLIINLSVSCLCIAARQKMLEVTDTLPANGALFEGCIQKPCAKLVQEVPAQLSPWGLPIVLVSFPALLGGTFHFHKQWMKMLARESDFGSLLHWCSLFQHASWIAGGFLLVACPLTILSSGLEEVETRLNEERMRTPSSHVEIKAVEAMFREVNHGQGWGIPVVKGFVLNKTMIQALLLRVLVAATVIKTFLDRQLGFQKEEQDDLNTELDVIANQAVTNITNFISNQTLGNLTALTAEILKNRNVTA